MSTTKTISAYKKPTKLNSSRERPDLRSTDRILQNLSKDILPPQPFLISVPTDRPFRQSSRLEGVWRAGTPFNFDEEQLQYLTFHSHQEEDTLLQALGGWSDESGNILREDEQKQNFLGSATSTPSRGPQKRKKITLGEYKKKGESQDGAQKKEESRPAAAKMAMAAVQAQSKELKRPDANGTMHSKKRPIEEVDLAMSQSKNATKPLRDEVPSAKKARISSPTKRPTKENTNAQEKSKVLPKLLSPNLPPTTVDRKLPRLLSPTLPPGLEEMLAKKFPSEMPNTPKKVAPNTSSQTSSQTSSVEKIKDKHPLKLDLHRERSGSQNSTKSTTSIHRSDHERKGKPSPSIVAAKDLQKIRQQQQEAQPTPRSKLVVTLKYGKRNSRAVQRLLKLAPKAKGTPERDTARREDKPTAKPAEKHPPSDLRKEKRPLSNASTKTGAQEPPAKRQKVPSTLETTEKPRTPVPQAFRSPLLQNSIAKSQLSTPKKAPKSIAMQRVESSEGDVRTPEAQGTYRNTTPLPSAPPRSATSSPSMTHQDLGKNRSTSKHAAASRPSSSATQNPTNSSGAVNLSSRTREETYRAWRSQRDKYFPVGRSIKRAAQQVVPRPPSSPSSSSAKLSSVLYIEGLLAFMLNLAVNTKSQSHMVDWRTIMDYWAFVRSALQHHVELRGLCLYLGAMCMKEIQRQDMDRIEKMPLPSGNYEANIPSAPTPGSDGQARIEGGEGDHRAKERYATMINDMTANFKKKERTAAEVDDILPWASFREKFVETWRRGMECTKGEVKKAEMGPENLNLSEATFMLPFTVQTSAFEVVGWGMASLSEWCSAEGVEWKSELAEVCAAAANTAAATAPQA
ncbi:MAG: hypothetical protein Q9160_006030 [Pyrenula sp. 1 TL-2023]